VSSPPIPPQPTGTASTPIPSQTQNGAASSIPIDDDPLDMFGGTPAPSTNHMYTNTNSNNNNQTDDFFADFAEAPPPSTAAPPAPHQYRIPPPSPSINNYQEVDLEGTDKHISSSSAPSPPPPPPLRTSGSTTSSTSSFKDRISEQPASTKAPHKAFQFLDAKQGAPALQSDGRNSSTASFEEYSTSAPVPPPLASSSHGGGHGPSSIIAPTTETVVEIGHRAAKALQMGTKWFMKASKQIATEVQSKIEKHRQHQHDLHSTSVAGTSGGMTTSHSFYFDWASQISRMSPGTRAAAMGAMQEDDRLEVQKIIDEAELGEIMLNSTRDGMNSSSSGRNGPLEQRRRKVSDWTSSDEEDTTKFGEQQQRETEEILPPPPSYGELMGSAAEPTPVVGNTHDTNRNSPPTAAVEVAGEVAEEDDLLCMDGDNNTDTTVTAANGGTEHIDDLFTVPKAPAAAAARPQRPSTTAAPSAPTAGRRSGAGGLSSMIDLGDSLPEVDTTGHSELYIEKESGLNGGEDQADEPEIRKILREKRIAEKHERMKQQLAEKRAREEAEDAEKAGKVVFRDTLKPKIDAWSANKKDNIRALLSTVHTVLWEDSGWTAPSIADMVDPGKVKKWYMKANLVVHPDKVKQKGGTLEQVATADMVFDVLKGAWGKFEASK
jgi:hypothetical protein